MNITIDPHSGFCVGVVRAIQKAEEELQKGALYCLGDIVHNGQEVKRLAGLGLQTIDYDQFRALHNAKVLLRAHGEPPLTYQIAQDNKIQIVDASCPVVRNLQKRISQTYAQIKAQKSEAQIVIFGKKGHAETIGLEGQTENTALVIEHQEDGEKVRVEQGIYLFAQTTKSVEEFMGLVHLLEQRRAQYAQAKGLQESQMPVFEWHDTICGQVRNRMKDLPLFAQQHDKVLFVGGKHSSNAKVLYELCRQANEETLFLSDPAEITDAYKKSCEGKSIGICGATSTPLWLMEACQKRLEE